MSKYPHDEKDGFVQSIRTTATATGFSEFLIEKDYFCSLILRQLYSESGHGLVFKGGTLINKVHAGFYRLSEDLDFSIDADPKLPKKKRSELAQPMKKYFKEVAKSLSLHVSKEITGQNDSSQYNGEIAYDSLLLGTTGTIKVEVGIRENVKEERSLTAKTLVRDAFTDNPLIEDFKLRGLSLYEAYAEKIRAATSRLNPAIRDIFDVNYALKKQLFKIDDIAGLVRYKFEVQNRTIKLTDERKKELQAQLVPQLRPVLRAPDYDAFDFESAWKELINVSKAIFK